MSEEPSKYNETRESDPEEKVDYKVIKNYGLASRSILRNSLYDIMAIGVIIFFLTVFLIIFNSGNSSQKVDQRVTELETKVMELETKVTNLEKKLTKLESQRSR